MVPTRIITAAKRNNLQAIGICDHNASENVEAVKKAGNRAGITVFGGIEVTSQEEIHILTIFDREESLAAMQLIVYENLAGKNNSEAFGEQYIVDEEDYVTGFNDKLLIGAIGLPIEGIISHIHRLGGLAIAAHIDRDAFSIISQLGIIPDNIDLDALELSPHYRASHYNIEQYNYPSVTFSDAHRLQDIGRASTRFYIKKTSLKEVKLALKGSNDRKVQLEIDSE